MIILLCSHAFRWYAILHTYLCETSSGHLKPTQRLQSLGFQTSISQGILVWAHRSQQNLFWSPEPFWEDTDCLFNLYSHITSSDIKNVNVRFKASNITWWTVPKMIIDNASNLARQYLNVIGSKNNPPTEHEAKIQQWATHTETQHTRCCCFESDKQNLGGKKIISWILMHMTNKQHGQSHHYCYYK